MDSFCEITLFGDYCRKRNAFESCSRSLHTEHQQAVRPQEASLIHQNEYASTSSIQAGFQAKLEISTDSYIATRARLVSMLRVWDAAMARKKYYDRTGYLDDDRDFMDSFLVAMQVIPDRARIGYLGPFSWEAIQGPPAYDEYADSSDYPDEPLTPPLTPPGGDPEVISVVSSDKESFTDADEDAYFPVDEDEHLERLDGDGDQEFDLDYVMEAIGRDSGMGAGRKRGHDEADGQNIRPWKRQCYPNFV